MARLTEASMSQDARQALSRVSTGFRGLYKAYTGEEPTTQKSAAQAAIDSPHAPDSTWSNHYAALKDAIGTMIGPAGSTGSAAVGTSGSTATGGAAAADATPFELTVPVRKDLVLLRQQIERFNTAAAGKTMPSTGNSSSSNPGR